MGFKQFLHAGNLRHGGDQPADDDIFLQSGEEVLRSANRRLGQHPGGLLEGCCRQEAVGQQRCPGYAEQYLFGGGGFSTFGQDLGVLFLKDESVDHLARNVLRVAGGLHLDPAEHLPENYLDMLVVDTHTLGLIDHLHLVHHVFLQVILSADVKDVVGV